MPFQIALSGLNAASADLSVTGHNIANAATLGFKGGRVEFSDVVVDGVRVSATPQQFGQGIIDFTGNSLDLAVSGEGFFTLSDGGALSYSRAGAFGVDAEGYVVNTSNQRLQVYPEAGSGIFDIGSLSDLRLTVGDSNPRATTEGEIGVNLPANEALPVTTVFDPSDPSSFNYTTSTTVFDSLGESHNATFYFSKDAAPNAWNTFLYVDDTAVGGANVLQYDANGLLTSPVNGVITYPPHDPGTGASNMDISFDYALSTQFGGDFSVNTLTQDGFSTGRLTGIDIDDSGVVLARFTNGVATSLGQVALSKFPNPQGLAVLGDNGWAQTFDSGAALRGEAGGSGFGLIQAGALEQSNVDLTAQLVRMITAQRNFQANAQMISTADTITQTIINLR